MSSFAKFAALPADWIELSPGQANGTCHTGERLDVTFRFVYAPDQSHRRVAGAEKTAAKKERDSGRPIAMNIPIGVLVPGGRTRPESKPCAEPNPRPVMFHGVVLALILQCVIGLTGWLSFHEFVRLLHW